MGEKIADSRAKGIKNGKFFGEPQAVEFGPKSWRTVVMPTPRVPAAWAVARSMPQSPK
jgi:hypothetical protein